MNDLESNNKIPQRFGMAASLFVLASLVCALLVFGVSQAAARNGVGITITKTASNPTPTEGDTFQYVIEVTATDLISPGLEVTDVLPAGLTYAGASFFGGAGQSWDPATGVWNTGIFNQTFNPVLTITARADLGTAGQTIINTAVTDTGESASEPVTIQQATADLVVTKSVDNPTPEEGDSIVYTIAIANNGPSTAQNIDVQEVIPAGVQLTNLSTTGGTYDVPTSLWELSQLTAGTVQTLTLTATVLPGTVGSTITNTASVTASDALEAAPGDESDFATITPMIATAELAVSKSVSDPAPNVGDTIAYTVVVENSGPSMATGVELFDLLPSGVNYLGATFFGAYDRNTGVWELPNVAANTAMTLTIQVQVLDSGMITNTASITASDQLDTDAADDADEAVIDVPMPTFSLTKSASVSTVNELDQFDYTLVVMSDQIVLGGIVITDVLPAGIELIGANGVGGTGFGYDPATGVWNTGDLNAGVSSILTLTVQAETGTGGMTITNTATGEMGLTDSAVITVLEPNAIVDLAISKVVDDTTPVEGESIQYVIVVENLGASTVNDIEVTEDTPAGIVLRTELSQPGSFDFATEIWTIPTLASGGVATLTLTADVASGFAGVGLTNIVTVTAPNATTTPSASATVTPELGTAELTLSKQVNDLTPTEGDFITYTVVVENAGPADATNVVVDDLLPSEVRLDGGQVSGSYDPATGIWTLPATLFAGNSYTLTLRVEIDAGTGGVDITNSAEIISTDQIDDPADNSETVVITPAVGATDMCISISVDEDAPVPGGLVVFTVELSNVGDLDATNIEALIPLPAGLTFTGYSTSGASYDQNTGIWGPFGSQSAGVTRTLVITASVDLGTDAMTITTTATVDSFDQNETTPANNSDDAVLNVPLLTAVGLAGSDAVSVSYPMIAIVAGVLVTTALSVIVKRREIRLRA